ncbi:glycosyltransferase family 1 protein [Novosphingobium sp.]|uniref:glycosyltransferase family 4 protein n=1 Tax=Novosphingobium sp. TaxID=1874826 RepID=UPI0025FF4D2A|nr:glycosyltransferase family 1 protein [Novosphingobium sp.]
MTKTLAGVDRTAQELVRALAPLASGRGWSLVCAVPANAPDDAEIRGRLGLGDESPILRSVLRGYLFEQVALSRAMPSAILLSLCNMGPILRRRQLVMLHDAQVFDVPRSYPLAFRQAYRFLQPRLARRAGAVVTVSEYSRTRLRANGVTTGVPVDVVHNGTDHFGRVEPDDAILNRFGVARKGYAFALGHPASHKNLGVLLQAYSCADITLPPLVLAGHAPAGLAAGDQSVIAVGRVSDRELKALYQNARMFLFPSLTEGFGFPALEAMACGCPVIAADAGAIPEVSGAAAIMVDPGNVRAWRTAIMRLHADDEERGRMIIAGIEQANEFTWDRAAKKLADIIGRLHQAI